MTIAPAADKSAGWTPAGLKAWGNALVKTGTEQLDLPMVRQGKQALKDAAVPQPAPPPKG